MAQSASALRKGSDKSYRTADTEMRAYIDAQQDAVAAKIDDIKQALREDRKPKSASTNLKDDVEPATPVVEIDQRDLKHVRIDVDSAENQWSRPLLLIAALISAGLAIYSYMGTAAAPSAIDTAATQPAQPAAVTYAVPSTAQIPSPSVVDATLAVVTPLPVATLKPVVPTQKPAPVKNIAPKTAPKPLRYSETL